MNLYLDCETTNLVKKEWHWSRDFTKFPRIVSIAWRMDGRDNYYILNQDGKKIPPRVMGIHGITDEMCNASKHYFIDIFGQLVADAMKADKIIGHNLYFDTSVIKANTLRFFGHESKNAETIIAALDKYKRIDLMRRTASFNGGWITLKELHQKLFGIEIKGHHALGDCVAVERCYLELVKRGILTENV